MQAMINKGLSTQESQLSLIPAPTIDKGNERLFVACEGCEGADAMYEREWVRCERQYRQA